MKPVTEVRRVPLDGTQVEAGSTLRPIARFELACTAGPPASVVLGQAEIFEREPVEYALARLRLEGAPDDAVQAIVTAAANAAPTGTSVYLPINAAVSPDHSRRRSVALAGGFHLLQEKEGFCWTDAGQPLAHGADLMLRPLPEVGHEPFAALISRCLGQTLDRIDALTFARYQSDEWARTLLQHHARGDDAKSWLYAQTPDGAPVGFVGLSQRAGEPGVGTIVHIGVAPGHRGHGYVDGLLIAGHRAARLRGLTTVLSHVDVENQPMAAAMQRAGADPAAHPWHKWLYRRRAE